MTSVIRTLLTLLLCLQTVYGENTLFKTLFKDTFASYDTSLWLKSEWSNGDPFLNGWCPEQITFSAGALRIGLEQATCSGRDYASGEYRTLNRYSYGRYTARFRASDVNGTITSLFVYTGPSEGTEWDEIDIEILGKDPSRLQVNYWRNGHEHPVVIDLGFDASAAMHTYAFVWSRDAIIWLVDDEVVYRVYENGSNDNDSLPYIPGKIMINLWAATGIESWSGQFEPGSSASAEYEFVSYEAEAPYILTPTLSYLLQ